jgi:hypothetical protein
VAKAKACLPQKENLREQRGRSKAKQCRSKRKLYFCEDYQKAVRAGEKERVFVSWIRDPESHDFPFLVLLAEGVITWEWLA